MIFIKQNIGIIYGGKSYEHEVSIITALMVFNNIDKEKYNVELFYITKENKIIIASNLHDIDIYKLNKFKNMEEIFFYQENNKTYYKSINKPKKKGLLIECMVVCCHGLHVEDGIISSLLSFNNLAYTCSDNKASAIVQDKHYTKLFLNHYNINTLDYKVINGYNLKNINNIKAQLTYPVIIKPAQLGSSVGINIARDVESFENGLKMSLNFENKLIIEPLLENFKEFNCAIYKYQNEFIISSVEEINNINPIYTYEDKYQNKDIKKTLPALISKEETEEIKELTKYIYQIFDLKGVVRIDYIKHNNKLYVNEINNIPGSLSYYLFKYNNISFTKLIDQLIKQAIIEKNKEIFKEENHFNILNKKTITKFK